MIRPVLSVLKVAILPLTVAVGACAPAETERGPEPAVDTSVFAEDSSLAVRPPDDANDPFSGFGLDRTVAAATETREVVLRLRNDGSEDALVYADGGAGEVQIDSVAAGGWTRIALETRAPILTLHSTDLGGRLLRRVEITVGVDSVREVIIGSP